MKVFLSLLFSVFTLGLAAAFSGPLLAHDGEAPMTQADCEKMPDMQWDAKTGKCVHK
jgi:hypothetical protein